MNQDNRPLHFAFNEQQLHMLFELISDGIWDWDANTGYVYRNPGWYAMFGYPCNSLANTVKTWEDIIHPDDYPRVMAHIEACIYQHEPYLIEYRCRCQDGRYMWIEDRAHVIVRNEDDSVARMLGAHRDIDAAKRLMMALQKENQSLEALVLERTRELSMVNAQLQRQLDENRELAERDALTHTANRYSLEKFLTQACERARRFRQTLSMIIMDVDDFKSINDRFGHIRGDKALVDVVTCISRCLRPHDLLARWGGDEFIVVMPETLLDEAHAVALQMQQTLADSEPVNGSRLTISYGVVQWKDNETRSDFLNRGDQALYQAKLAGKNAISR